MTTVQVVESDRSNNCPSEWRWRVDQTFGEVYSARTGHTVVEHDKCFYLFGGTDKKKRQKDLYQFDSRTSKWTRLYASGDIPSRRSGAVGVANPKDGKMYVFGGYEGRDGRYFSDVHCLDLKTLRWKLIQPRPADGHNISNNSQTSANMPIDARDVGAAHMQQLLQQQTEGIQLFPQRLNKPSARTDHCLVCHDGALVMFGGFNGQNRFNDTHQFDLCTQQWRELNKMQSANQKPSRRFGHSGTVFQDKLWIFGGWDGRDTLSCVWALDLRTELWSSLDTLRAQLSRRMLPVRRTGADANPTFILEQDKTDKENAGVVHNSKSKSKSKSNNRSMSMASTFDFGAGWFAFGGNNKNKSDSSAVKRRSSDLEPLPSPNKKASNNNKKTYHPMNRYRHSAVVLGSAMIVFGGVNKEHNRFNDVNRLNLETLEWERLECRGMGLTARTFHRAITMDDRMYVLGGYDGEHRLNDMHSIYLGALTPAPLSQLIANYVRKNVSDLARAGTLGSIPQSIIEGHIWARDTNGDLRGGCVKLAGSPPNTYAVRVCHKFELPPWVEAGYSKDNTKKAFFGNMDRSRAHSSVSSVDEKQQDEEDMEVDEEEMEVDEEEMEVDEACQSRCFSCGGLAAWHDLVREEDLFSDELNSQAWQPDWESANGSFASSSPEISPNHWVDKMAWEEEQDKDMKDGRWESDGRGRCANEQMPLVHNRTRRQAVTKQMKPGEE